MIDGGYEKTPWSLNQRGLGVWGAHRGKKMPRNLIEGGGKVQAENPAVWTVRRRWGWVIW